MKIHPLADVQSTQIGEGTTIWQFAVILPKAIVGKNCNINCHTFIENDVIIGDRVTVKPGVFIWDGLRIEDDVFIGPNVTFVNDKYPRSKKYPELFQTTHIAKGASIGANATILGGVTIGEYAMIGAGSVVTKNIQPFTLVYGNPAKVIGRTDENQNK
ncbi:MAG: N-acetyltransferase [Bacteroidota bacterium]|nr:N-acetyltransferase [Bacteroidota bacterium]